MTSCPTCHQPADALKSVAHDGRILRGCDRCLHTQVQGNELVAKHNRDYQKAEYRKDTLQLNEPGYARAYPERFRDVHGDEALRQYG